MKETEMPMTKENEAIEGILHASPEQVRQAQDQGIRRMMGLCQEGHRYYQRRFEECGIAFSSIRSIDDLEAVPLTAKHDYMKHHEDFVLHIPEAPADEKIVYNILYTTGTTTGRPTPFYNTTHDYFATLLAAKRIAGIIGITPSDVIANTFPLTRVPHLTFFAATCYAMVSGAKLINTLTGTPYPGFPVTNSSRTATRMIHDSAATIIWGIPSFVRRTLILAEEMGLVFPSVRLAAVSGEPCSAGLRQDIIKRLQGLGAASPRVNNRYGFTEISTVLVECDPEGRGGFHNPAPDLFFLEVVDEETGKRLADGQSGYLAVTHLNRRGTVLIRYLTGDIVALSHEPCPFCGRRTQRIVTQPYRRSELIKFKGTLINPKPLLAALSEVREIEEFQVVFTRENPEDLLSPDHLLIRVSTKSDPRALEAKVKAVTLQSVEMRPEVVFVDQDSIYDPDKNFKSLRIVDQRV